MQHSTTMGAESVWGLFSIGQIVSRDDTRRSIAVRIVMSMQGAWILRRVRCINIVEKTSSKCFFLHNQTFRPTLSTNLFDRPFRSTFSTNPLDQQNAFHSRDCRCPFSLDDDERHPCVLRSWPVRHQHLREDVLPLWRNGSYLRSRNYLRAVVFVRCLKIAVWVSQSDSSWLSTIALILYSDMMATGE